MQRLMIAAAALGLAACGVEEDNRPHTLEYVTSAVLAPNCGNAQCHSSFARVEDYAFDTVEESRDSIMTYSLVVAGDAESSLLYQVLISPGGDGQAKRMPYDQPIPNKDIQLIYDWIDRGATGLTP